jgi:hypothetical protein
MEGSCEDGNEPSGSIKCWEVLAASQEGLSSMKLVINTKNAGIGQSVWMTKGWEFESRQCQEFSLPHFVQTDSGAHTASYTMGNGGLFPRDKAAGA